MSRVQKVINFGARVITGRRKRDHISDALRYLTWLPARELVIYHTLCLLIKGKSQLFTKFDIL